MTFSIGMRTFGRPQTDYCRATLARLVETGTLQHQSLRGFHLHHGEGISPNANGVGALRLAAKDGADWVIFLEDDIDLINDFLGSVGRWLSRFADPDVLAYPLGCFYSEAMNYYRDAGAWKMPLDKYYGSQAIAFRTADASDYAEWLAAEPRETAFDIHVQWWHKLRRPVQSFLLTPAPCFIDHTGEQSLMGTWTRTGRIVGFGGREFSYGI